MVICPACGARVQHGREEVDWREQVRETVERHKAKRRRERTRHDDEARQLSIFPDSSERDAEQQAARARRAEIRARVEERLSNRSGNRASDPPRDAGQVPLVGGAAAAAAALPRAEPSGDVERDIGSADRDVDPTTTEFSGDQLDAGGEIGIHHDLPRPDASEGSSEPFIGFGLATPGERLLSGLIDLAFVSLIQLTLFYLTTHLVAQRLGALPTSAVVAMALVGVVLAAGYFLFFWSLSGQTLGKLLTGGRVVDGRGHGALGFTRAVLRLLGACLSAAPLGAGFLGLWTDSERRGWHDRIAGTKVVRG